MVREHLHSSGSTGVSALRGVLDTVPVGIAIFGPDGAPRLVNRYARDVLADLASVPLPRWLEQQRLRSPAGEPLDAASLPLLATLTDGAPRREVEVQLHRPNGTVASCLMSSEAIRDPSGEIVQVVCSLTFTTDWREKEERSRQGLKMEAIGTLASSLGGPFNDAVTAIQGYCELAKDRLDRSDPVRHVISEIQQAGDRAARLTGRLLAHAEKEVPEPEDVELDAWLRGQLSVVRSQLGDHVTLEVEPCEAGCWVRVDPRTLEQVLSDLVANARDALNAKSPEEGRLRLSTGRVTIDEGLADLLGGASAGSYGVLTISDTGGGMEERILPRVFEPFFTTKSRALGLGLATVDRLVRSQGGHVRVESRRGEGSTFHVGLPLVRVPDPAEDVVEASFSANSFPRGTTVLLVEDDPIVRDLVRQVLEMQHLRVVEAITGAEGLQVVEDRGSTLDLMISDVVMPGLGGDVLAQRVRERSPNLKVLLMSGCSDPERLAVALEDGTTAFLAKPFAPGGLVAKVRGLLLAPAEASPTTSATPTPVHDLDLHMQASTASDPKPKTQPGEGRIDEGGIVELEDDVEIGPDRIRTPPIL